MNSNEVTSGVAGILAGLELDHLVSPVCTTGPVIFKGF